MKALDIIFAIIIIFCALSVAIYILPTIKNEQTRQINAVFSLNLPEILRYRLISGQQLFDTNMRPVGMITSIYSIDSFDSENNKITLWRMNASLVAAKNNQQLMVAGTPLYYGTYIRMFTSDTEFTAQFLDF